MTVPADWLDQNRDPNDSFQERAYKASPIEKSELFILSP